MILNTIHRDFCNNFITASEMHMTKLCYKLLTRPMLRKNPLCCSLIFSRTCYFYTSLFKDPHFTASQPGVICGQITQQCVVIYCLYELLTIKLSSNSSQLSDLPQINLMSFVDRCQYVAKCFCTRFIPIV